MQSIKVKCGGCKKHFNFQHPSVTVIEQLMSLTISCPKCKTLIKAPSDAIRMEPIEVLVKL